MFGQNPVTNQIAGIEAPVQVANQNQV